LWNRYSWQHPLARRKPCINNLGKSIGLGLSLTAMADTPEGSR